MTKGSLRGFTLIELSIVLVVIGLIVGGVLVGQDLVRAAAVRAQISQIEKYNTAVNTFRDKYGYLPGDIPTGPATTFGFDVAIYSNGTEGFRDGNGLIEGGGSGVNLAAIRGENLLFWADLTVANLIEQPVQLSTYSCAAINLTTSQIGQYLPNAAIGYGNFVSVYSINGYNYFSVAQSVNNTNCRLYQNSVVPVIQAYRIDSKIDDGVPDTGRVIAAYINGSQVATTTAPNAAADSATTCYNTATTPSAYSVTYKGGAGTNCALSFRFQ